MFLGLDDSTRFAAKATENRVLYNGLLRVGHDFSLKLGFAFQLTIPVNQKKSFNFFWLRLNSLNLKYLFLSSYETSYHF
jgi:hypothetical protein